MHDNEFQTVGPHSGKARGPEVKVLVHGTLNSRCAAERKNRRPGIDETAMQSSAR